MWRTVLSVLTVFIFTYSIVQAQETTSEITGLINAGTTPAAGATVTALNNSTGTKYSTTTRSDGRYNLPNLKVGGLYTITVSYVGYGEDKQDSVTLLLGQEFKADFTLKTETSTLAEVVVSTAGQNKIFNNSRTGTQEIISRNQIERLPTVNRSLQDFTKLAPSSNGLNIGGRNNLYNNITVDGANFNNAFGLSSVLGGQTNSQPISLDAIEQIQVNISPFDVRQGGFSGTGINTVTRSGTNKFKGTVYTYLRGPGTQGYKVKTTEVPRQDFKYNLRGFAVGGPIIKNKLFFFVSGESERITTPATSYVASTASDPYTGSGNISFANADTLTALKDFLVSNYGYNPGDFQGYSYKTYSNKITAKLDWNISTNTTLSLKYNYLKSYRDIAASNSGAPGTGRQPGLQSLPFSGSGYKINNNFNIFIAEVNNRFGNRSSNKLQLGYTALRDYRASLSGADFPLVDIMDGQGNTYTSFGYEPFTYNNLLNTDIYQFSDYLSLYAGAHELTLGTQNYYKKFKNGFAPNYAGAYRFNTLTDFYNSARFDSANAVQYQLQYAATKGGSFPFAKVGALELGFFAQDKWRITNNFTFTYGIRVDAPIYNNDFETNPNVPALTFRDRKHYDVGEKPGTNLQFSPRAGFNWDVAGNHTTQVRGGIGLFSGPPPFVWISNQASNNGVQFGSFTNKIDPSTGKPYVFSPDINTYRPADVAENTSYNLVFTDHDFKYPQVLKASIAVDQKLPANFTVSLEGTYSKDVNAVYFQNVNLPSTGITLAGPDPRIRYDSSKIYQGKTVNNPNISSAILMTNSHKGYSYFITFQLQKPMRNFYMSAAYTYSRSKSLNDGGSIAASMWRDRYVTGDPNADELGFSNYYLPHRIIATLSYRKEYAKHFGTSVGLVYEAAPSGVGSYTYNGDLNNDATGGNNDLIYIPRSQQEITLVPVANGATVNGVTDTRTPDQIWAQLNNFINQDKYLYKHRGEVAERNAVVFPWFSRVDFNLTQDIYFFTGKDKDKHTLRLSMDIINAGNFLNRQWGTYKTLANGSTFANSFLKYEGLADGNVPTFSFPYLDAKNEIPYTNSFKNDTGILSRWQMQFGLRYLFN